MTAPAAPMEAAVLPGPASPPRREQDRHASALYEGAVRHRRHSGPSGSFTTDVLMVYLDLEELPDLLDGHPLWSARRAAPMAFRARDHLDGTASSPAELARAVRDLVQQRLGADTDVSGAVRLLTQPRTLGWLFNPIAIYFCFDGEDRLQAVVCEVTNTPWHDRHWYVVPAGPPTGRAGIRRARFAKEMHVSPFLGMDLHYRLSFSEPDHRLWVRLEAIGAEGDRVFDADLVLRRRAIDRWSMVRTPLRHPFTTLKTSLGIYIRALRLWLRGAPFHRHPHRREVR